jgi:Ca2+-binding RTX toxin-like protein
MNNNWERVSTQSITLNSFAAFAQETVFGVDANGDGTIGSLPTVALESIGNTSLVKDSSNKLFAQVGNTTPIDIKNGTTHIYEGIYADWQILAVETVNGVNQILWTNAGSNTMHVWQMNNNWERVSTQSITLNSFAAFAQETVFGVDANGDGTIGSLPTVALESIGNTSLVKDSSNKLFAQVGNTTPIAINNGTTHINEGIYAGWQTLAAETVNGENQVLWKNAGSNGMHVWHMNSGWGLVSKTIIGSLTSADAFSQETVFGVDTNGDGFIGNSNSLTLTGTSANDTLVGGANSDVLTGLGGKDSLTGGSGSDRFVYQMLTDSLLANYDGIADFNATHDLFLVSTARTGFSDAGVIATLDNAGISASLTNANFGANSAASFTFGSRTFVAINDATAGFNQANDAIIEVTGLTGTLGLTNFVIA